MRPTPKPGDCPSFKAFLGNFITQWIQVRATAMRKLCTIESGQALTTKTQIYIACSIRQLQNTMRKMLHGVKYIKDNKSKMLVNNYYSKRIKAKYLLACAGSTSNQ